MSSSITIEKANITFPSAIRRFIAYVIDSLLLSFPIMLIEFLVMDRALISVQQLDPTSGKIDASFNFPTLVWNFKSVLVSLSVCILYYSIWESSRWQATIGKKWLGLNVANIAGARMTLFRAFFRTCTYVILNSLPMMAMLAIFGLVNDIRVFPPMYLQITTAMNSCMGMPLLILSLVVITWLYIPVFFTKEKSTIYDMITGTHVYCCKTKNARPTSIAKAPATTKLSIRSKNRRK